MISLKFPDDPKMNVPAYNAAAVSNTLPYEYIHLLEGLDDISEE